MRPDFDLSLYLVTDRPLAQGRDIEWIVSEAVKGGVTMVQLREKDCSTEEFIALGLRLKKLLQPSGIPLIINDRVDVALAVDADGVHIGQSDMSYAEARRLLVMKHSRHRCVAIGGMNKDTVGSTIAEGVEGVAVVSAIIAAPDPQASARQLLTEVEANRPTWSQTAWKAALPVVEHIKQHPFVQGIMTGTAPLEGFVHYLQQDMIYLGNYADEMNALSELMPDGFMQQLFHRLAEEGVTTEQELHVFLAQKYNVQEDKVPGSFTQGYMDYTGTYLEKGRAELAIAALLPCFWVYNEIGHYIASSAPQEDHPYKAWIDTYESPQMDYVVRKVIEVADKLAHDCSQATQAEMRRIFVGATEWEYKFFNNGLNE